MTCEPPSLANPLPEDETCVVRVQPTNLIFILLQAYNTYHCHVLHSALERRTLFWGIELAAKPDSYQTPTCFSYTRGRLSQSTAGVNSSPLGVAPSTLGSSTLATKRSPHRRHLLSPRPPPCLHSAPCPKYPWRRARLLHLVLDSRPCGLAPATMIRVEQYSGQDNATTFMRG